jgi:hypothetical protein
VRRGPGSSPRCGAGLLILLLPGTPKFLTARVSRTSRCGPSLTPIDTPLGGSARRKGDPLAGARGRRLAADIDGVSIVVTALLFGYQL